MVKTIRNICLSICAFTISGIFFASCGLEGCVSVEPPDYSDTTAPVAD